MSFKQPDPPYVVGIPPGTRFAGLTRELYNDELVWRAWLGIKNKQDNPSRWQGTSLLLFDSGEVLRVQNDPPYAIPDVWLIKEADK